MSPETLRFNLKNDLVELDCLKQGVRCFCDDLGLSKRETFQLMFSVEEIFVNIVSYAYNDENEHIITVFAEYEDGILTLRFEDDGIYFNPLIVEEPDVSAPLDDRDEGGLGLHLTRKLMSKIDYRRVGDKNRLVMKKKVGFSEGDTSGTVC